MINQTFSRLSLQRIFVKIGENYFQKKPFPAAEKVFKPQVNYFPKKVNYFSTAITIKQNSIMAEIISCDFEVFGKVQGVFFRKHTQSKGNELGIRGWCRNTSQGTVEGTMEGPRSDVEKMKDWLKTTGSPKSKISKADFHNEKIIKDYNFKNFDIHR